MSWTINAREKKERKLYRFNTNNWMYGQFLLSYYILKSSAPNPGLPCDTTTTTHSSWAWLTLGPCFYGCLRGLGFFILGFVCLVGWFLVFAIVITIVIAIVKWGGWGFAFWGLFGWLVFGVFYCHHRRHHHFILLYLVVSQIRELPQTRYPVVLSSPFPRANETHSKRSVQIIWWFPPSCHFFCY